ncbi:alanine racemase [Mycolicibacterium canariasense]|uniref:Alanine racemase n=1 Tax=Mycolicibacterium canariasense TaxID=228230 RepID=A0A100WFJ8_MYCCR|nr:hypothetical protein [Mycolicibacterium canariasense]MCV7213408.1 hypothetical protein [Mycolicibacterium canariasense]GAS97044.1 alanine racemase [Mycolicibacterium canariasense]
MATTQFRTSVLIAAVAALLTAVSCSSAPPSAPQATCPTASAKISLPAVVGFGSDVFVAKITAKDAAYDGFTGPVQTYQAIASVPLMGSANGPVRIGAGSVLIDGKPCRYGLPLPEVGKSYLLAANYDKGTHVFVTGVFEGGMTPLSDAEIAKIGTPDEPAVIKAMREAVKNPIYPSI